MLLHPWNAQSAAIIAAPNAERLTAEGRVTLVERCDRFDIDPLRDRNSAPSMIAPIPTNFASVRTDCVAPPVDTRAVLIAAKKRIATSAMICCAPNVQWIVWPRMWRSRAAQIASSGIRAERNDANPVAIRGSAV